MWAQKANCGCTKQKIDLEEPISCDPIVFKNGSKLHWQWNCDSIWLTFENRQTLIQNTIRTCEIADINLCRKIGLVFLKEYPHYLLFKDVLIPDSNSPADIIFFSQENGDETRRIHKDLIVRNDADNDYLLYFSDASYKKLVYLNYNKVNQFNSITFDANKVSGSVDKNEVSELSGIFSNFKQVDNYFTFDFKNAAGQIEKLKIENK